GAGLAEGLGGGEAGAAVAGVGIAARQGSAAVGTGAVAAAAGGDLPAAAVAVAAILPALLGGAIQVAGGESLGAVLLVDHAGQAVAAVAEHPAQVDAEEHTLGREVGGVGDPRRAQSRA